VNQDLPLPDRDRLSSLTALVLITYGLIRMVFLPGVRIEFPLLGLLIQIEINTRLIMLILAAILTTAGADWLIRAHPNTKGRSLSFEHLIIPGLATLAGGAIVTRLPTGLSLWLGLTLSAALLMAAVISEFIVVDRGDPRYDGTALGLTILAYLLLFGAFFVFRLTGFRALFAVPLTLLASGSVSWRLLKLDFAEPGQWPYAMLIGLIAAQLAFGLHYWPVSPLRGALLLDIFLYLGNGLMTCYLARTFRKDILIEYISLAGLALLIILILT
jgi:hypothetical protein